MRKEMILLKKRTNNQEGLFQYIAVMIIPFFIVVSLIINGIEKSFEKIMYTGALLSNPRSIFTLVSNDEKSDNIDELSNSENIQTGITKVAVSTIPDDIQKLKIGRAHV